MSKAALTSLLFLILGCSQSSSWALYSIDAGDREFNASKLRYISSIAYAPLMIELMQVNGDIETFVSLSKFQFSSKGQVKVSLSVGEDEFEEDVPVNEGRMRLRLSSEMTGKLIQGLQDGEKVVMIVDGFEEIFDTAQFSSTFAKLKGEGSFFKGLLKGPME